MKIVKSVLFVLVLLFVFEGAAFAGAPAPITERPIPVEQFTPPPPPPPPPSAAVKPLVISKHFTWGLGLGGNPIVGIVEKDEYGYSHTEYTAPFYGINWVLGFGVTWYKGQPSPEDISAAVQRIKQSNPAVTDKELPSLVRKKLNVNSLTYVGLGTALLVVPVNAEMGIQWIINDNTRTRLGIGLPTLICFGINWDF